MANPHEQAYWQAYGGSLAENYERYLVPTIFGPFAADLVEVAGAAPGERVLDVACGTGIGARLAAERVGPNGRVTGLDVNPGMLAVARSAAPSGVSIEWQEASAEAMPLPDNAFDVVLCQQGLQFFPNKPATLREMHRVLVPGGRLAVSVWRPIEHCPLFAILAEALERHVGPESAAFLYAAFPLGSPDELRELLSRADFREVVVRPASKAPRLSPPEEFLQQYVASAPFGALVRQADDSARAALAREFADRCQPYVNDQALASPLETHVATARK